MKPFYAFQVRTNLVTKQTFRLRFPTHQFPGTRVTCFYLLFSDHVRRPPTVVENALPKLI